MKKSFAAVFPPLFFVTIVLALTEFLVRSEIVPAFLVPSPSQVFTTFLEFLPDLTTALIGTARATLLGLLMSFLIGQGLALLLSLSDFARRALFPFAVFFQTVPIIAIAPLLVIWFGFGEPTVRASAAIVSFFPILSNALVGLESSRREYLELFQVIGGSKMQTLLKLQIPSSVRASFAGLRIAAGLAVVGALVGEFVGGGGLGSLIDSARTQQRVDLVFACVILSALLGLVLIGIVFVLEFLVQKWRPFHES
jgi:NitT/TauT family transport system permease protein